MTLTRKTVTELLEDFRSPAPTPGGGSAAALAGAVGASLLAMVAGLPKPRAARRDEDLRCLRDAGERCTALATDLEALVDRDSEAYELVVSAYRLPKGTDDEKAARARGIQDALKAAIAAPLEVMRACGAGARLGPVLAGARQRECVERCAGGTGAAARGAPRRARERRDQPRQREGSGVHRRGRRRGRQAQ